MTTQSTACNYATDRQSRPCPQLQLPRLLTYPVIAPDRRYAWRSIIRHARQSESIRSRLVIAVPADSASATLALPCVRVPHRPVALAATQPVHNWLQQSSSHNWSGQHQLDPTGQTQSASATAAAGIDHARVHSSSIGRSIIAETDPVDQSSAACNYATSQSIEVNP